MKLSLVLSLIGLPITSAYLSSKDEEVIDGLVSWLRSKNGGYLNEKTEIRRLKSEESRLGIFSKEEIFDRELILSVPDECLITADGIEGDINCELASNLYDEMKKGSRSEFEPYLNYLSYEVSPSFSKIPAAWSEKGKNLLSKLLNHNNDDSYFPPQDILTTLGDYESCDGYKYDPVGKVAFIMSLGKKGIHVPIYDIMSHRHGNFNTIATSTFDSISENKVLKIRAARDIGKGEEIYGSYKIAEDGDNEIYWKTYGTFEVLRDKGELEGFPQRWFFDEFFAFELDSIKGSDGEEKLKVEWVGDTPVALSKDIVLFRDYHLPRLEYLSKTRLAENENNLPEEEWEIIKQLINALISSISTALDDIDSYCLSEPSGFCTYRYDELHGLQGKGSYFTDYLDFPCNEDNFVEDFKSYVAVDVVQSKYQTTSFHFNPKNRDVCLAIDGMYQTCSSYRPHYHEMVVHYTASYLSEVKRVLWVGGGDSMLLHEIMKYPSLELVVGLEIDQKVTRYAFKHFGTQPHWDNTKVQWWYGDAAKSLQMLPKEYYGSFDLVLVDLSETVTSNSVTQNSDIFESLSLLLKPQGIFVKNERSLERISKIFNYALEIEFSDVPYVCSQTLVLGSRNIDFMFRDVHNHHIDTVYYNNSKHVIDRYEMWHNYKKNIGNDQKLCKRSDARGEEEPAQQVNTAGILMVVEAEDISIDIESSSNLKEILVGAIEKEMTLLSNAVSDSNDVNQTAAIVICEEGYVMARAWPESKYCSLDIHLWSSFEKHEKIKNTLLVALQSQSSSSYRVVAGGMFGVSTWKQDETKRGPKFPQVCNVPSGTKLKNSVDSNVVDLFLVEVLSVLVHSSKLIVVVLCGGDKSLKDCSSFTIASSMENVYKTVALRECPNHKSESRLKSKLECEKNILDVLRFKLAFDEKIHVIIHDDSSGKEIAQILLKIINNRINRKRLLSSEILLLTTGGESWKKEWMDRFRNEVIIYNPLFIAQTFFNSTESTIAIAPALARSYEFCILSNDNEFIGNLVNIALSISQRAVLVPDIMNIYGGRTVYMPNFEATQIFSPEAYTQTESLNQWKTQQPLSFQTVFQLKTLKEGSISTSLLKQALSDAIVNKTTASTSSISEVKDGIGNGSLHISFMENIGTVVVTWDGKNHVDFNLYTYKENIKFANRFVNEFKKQIPSMSVVLRDDQPRGYGRVVNFKKDVQEPRGEPHWSWVDNADPNGNCGATSGDRVSKGHFKT